MLQKDLGPIQWISLKNHFSGSSTGIMNTIHTVHDPCGTPTKMNFERYLEKYISYQKLIKI